MERKPEQISKDIAAFERKLSEAGSNEVLIEALTKKLTKLRNELKGNKMSARQLASNLLGARKKVREMAAKDFKGLILQLSKKPEYYFLKRYTKSEIKDDMSRPAKPVGYRFVGRGNYDVPSKRQITKGLKDGSVYSERRPKRSDVSRVAQLAKGGEIKDLQIDQIASLTGVRKEAIKTWAKSNDLSDNDLGNVMMGLGRKQIAVKTFVSAIMGNDKNNNEILSYSKSNKGYKMATGGSVDRVEGEFWVEDEKTNFGYVIKVNKKDKGLTTISYHKTKKEAQQEVDNLNKSKFATGGGVTYEDYEKRLQYLKMKKNNERTDLGKYQIDKEIRTINAILKHRENLKDAQANKQTTSNTEEFIGTITNDSLPYLLAGLPYKYDFDNNYLNGMRVYGEIEGLKYAKQYLKETFDVDSNFGGDGEMGMKYLEVQNQNVDRKFAKGGGVDKSKRRKFVLYTNPNNVTNKAYVAIGEDVKDVLSDSREYPGSYYILYKGTGTNEDLQKAKAMYSNYSFSNDETIMATGGSVEKLNLTELETKILRYFLSKLDVYQLGYSDVSVDDIANGINVNINSVKGSVGSLAKKGIIFVSDLGKGIGTIVYLEDDYEYLHPEYKDYISKFEDGGEASKGLTTISYHKTKKEAQQEVDNLNKSKFARGGNMNTSNEDSLKTLQDPKKLYVLLNEAEANFSKDGGAEYKRIGELIRENRKNYFNLLNQAEANFSKDGGAEYNKLLSLHSKYYEKGGSVGKHTETELNEFAKTYEKNEDINHHTENLILLAETFGGKADITLAKEIQKRQIENNGIQGKEVEKYKKLHKKLSAKWQKVCADMGVECYATGGQITDVRKWIEFDGYSNKEIKSVFDALEDAGYNFPRSFKIFEKSNQEKFNEKVWAKSSSMSNDIRIEILPGDLSKNDVQSIIWGMIMTASTQYGMGGDITAFFKATKETLKKGYNKSKAYTNKKIHDTSKKIALDVIDKTKGKVKSNKEKMTLKASEEILLRRYGKGGGIEVFYVYGKFDEERKWEPIKKFTFEKEAKDFISKVVSNGVSIDGLSMRFDDYKISKIKSKNWEDNIITKMAKGGGIEKLSQLQVDNLQHSIDDFCKKNEIKTEWYIKRVVCEDYESDNFCVISCENYEGNRRHYFKGELDWNSANSPRLTNIDEGAGNLRHNTKELWSDSEMAKGGITDEGRFTVEVNQYIPYKSNKGVNYYYVVDEMNNVINKNTGKIYRGKQMDNYKFTTKEEAENYANSLNSKMENGGQISSLKSRIQELRFDYQREMSAQNNKSSLGRSYAEADLILVEIKKLENQLRNLSSEQTKMAKGGAVEHGIKRGDKIISIAGGNVIEVEGEDGEKYLINLNVGKRIAKKDYTMDSSQTTHKEFFKMAKGGAVEHGIKRGDKIISIAGGNVIEVEGEDGEKYLINLNVGKRIAKKDYTMDSSQTTHKEFFKM